MHCLTFLSQHIVLTLRRLPAEGGPHSITTSNQIALIHLFPHSVSDKSQLFPSCLPQYKHARSFTRPPSPLTGAGGFTNPTSRGRIHSEGGGRWRVCVCLRGSCLETVRKHAKSSDCNLGAQHVKHLVRQKKNQNQAVGDNVSHLFRLKAAGERNLCVKVSHR